MRSSLLALGLLGLMGCNETASTSPTSSQISLANLRPYSLDLRALTSDVERWTRDGHLDVNERIAILSACGYRIRSSLSWFRPGSCIWTDECWHPLTRDILYGIPLDQPTAELFVAHYMRR